MEVKVGITSNKTILCDMLDKNLRGKSMADREGFEPSVILRLRILSRDVVSANSPTGPTMEESSKN